MKPWPAVHPAAPVTRSERAPERGVVVVAVSAIEAAAVEDTVGVPVGSPEVSATDISVQPWREPFSKLDFR
jgi:hypothetical protein